MELSRGLTKPVDKNLMIESLSEDGVDDDDLLKSMIWKFKTSANDHNFLEFMTPFTQGGLAGSFVSHFHNN